MYESSYNPKLIPRPDQRSRLDPQMLEAPDVPVAFHDQDTPGLLPVSALVNPVVVTLKVWAAAQRGYMYYLVWDDRAVGPMKEIMESNLPGDPLTLEIPVELLTEGSHKIQYATYNPVSEIVNFSFSFTVVVDKTAPGSPELSRIEFPAVVDNGLTAAELAQFGDRLPANIAGYTGMAKHDLVQTFWGDIQGPTALVTEDDMGLNRVVISFSGDSLRSLGDGEKLAHYRIYDRAGNLSIDSNPAQVLLKLADVPSNFPAPIIDPDVGVMIDYIEAQAGVRLDIPQYTNASAYDEIRVMWGEGNPLAPVSLPPGNEDDEIVLSLSVPFEAVAALPPGRVAVSYEVYRRGELVGSSRQSSIDVFVTLPVTSPLDAIIIQGTSVQNPDTSDNFIDEDDYELNARAIVRWNNDFQISDDLNLFWGDQQLQQWYQIRSSDVIAERDLIIPIDNGIMKSQGTGVQIPVYFTLTRTGNPNPAKCPTQDVVVRSKEELPGGVDGLNGPPFNLNSGGYIAPILNPNGAELKISPYLNIAKDQKITVTFRGFDDNNTLIEEAGYTASRELDEFDIINGYTFTVPYRNLRIICTGFAEASFKVEPPPGSNQSTVTSKITRAPVHMLDSIELTCSLR
jgi:hypothetical protein